MITLSTPVITVSNLTLIIWLLKDELSPPLEGHELFVTELQF